MVIVWYGPPYTTVVNGQQVSGGLL